MAIVATSAVAWHHGGITVRQMLLNATMVSGYLGVDYVDGVYWTLQIELKFYVLIFALLVIGQIKNAENWAYGWLALTAIALVTHVIPGSFILYPYGSYFAAGMILFQVWTSGLTPVRGVALAASVILSMRHATVQVDDFVYQLTADRWVPAAVILCAYIVLLGIATRRIRIGSQKLCTALGASTYPLYLLHNRIGHEIFGALTLDRWTSLGNNAVCNRCHNRHRYRRGPTPPSTRQSAPHRVVSSTAPSAGQSKMNARSHADDESRREFKDAIREATARIGRRGVYLHGNETNKEIVELDEALEQFEHAVRSHGGDLMMDEAPAGHHVEPDDPRFALPQRVGTMSVPDYIALLDLAFEGMRMRC